MKKIEIGVHSALSIEDYHNSEGISKSGLMKIKRSPKHYWDAYLSDKPKEETKSKELILGNLVHTMIMEPQEYSSRFVMIPDFDRRTKEGKEKYNAFVNDEAGKEIIDIETHVQANHIVMNAFQDEEIVRLIDGNIEHSFYWEQVDEQVLCKCRPDIYNERFVSDIKTTRDASPESFARDIYNFGYHIQAAMIQEGIFKTTGIMIRDFFLIALEKEPPYASAIYLLDDEALLKGRADFLNYLKIYKKSLITNTWEGYPTQYISLPKWVF